jgi:hypothetical protein
MNPTDHVDDLVARTRATYASTLLIAADAARNHRGALIIAKRLATDPAVVHDLEREIVNLDAEENRLRLWATTTPRGTAR